MKISLNDAKEIILSSQGLANLSSVKTLDVIENLGHVQIDTIAVIERAHHHTLWSRNLSYQPEELGALLARRKIFEYWSHAASYLPMSSYRFALPKMYKYRTSKSHWFKIDKKTKSYVLDRIKAEGPLKASQFESDGKRTGWFDWKPAKKALEQHFMAGTLMVTRREGFQKVYDLSERVLPNSVSTTLPSVEELAQFIILSQLKNHGLATTDELSYLRGTELKKAIKQQAMILLEDKKIQSHQIDGQSKVYYSLTKNKPVTPLKKEVHILSPFDNLVIQRKRLKELFVFDYQIECYVPGPKRKFGYFCLPILQGDRFIGRIDTKAVRDERVFQVKSLFPEPGISRPKFKQIIKDKVLEFAQFNQCDRVAYPVRS
jgi:hypothetical protein